MTAHNVQAFLMVFGNSTELCTLKGEYRMIRKTYKKITIRLAAVLGLAMILIIASIPAGAAEEETDMIEKLISGMTLQEKVSQMMMVDFRTWNENPEDESSEAVPVTQLREEIRQAVSEDRFGGIILFAENCAENEQTYRLVQEYQEANRDTQSGTVIPLLIATDQEGGIITRLGHGTGMIGNMALAATGNPENAGTEASILARELKTLSINTDFAPVLDVNNNPSNPVIGVRSFSDDPQMVSLYGTYFLEGLSEYGVIASLKHFPGHGDTDTDSHTGLPMVGKTYEQLKECELIPFQAAIDAGAEMIMSAHIQYPEIEKGTYISVSTGEEVYIPATLSKTILTDILRGDMDFDGVIVSDALNMDAIASHFKPEDVCRMAIEAGVDLFLMPMPVKDAGTLQKLEDMIGYIVSMVEEGVIPEERIDESVRRILSLKQAHDLLTYDETGGDMKPEVSAALAEVGSEENHQTEWTMMQNAVTLLKNDGDTLPIKMAEGGKALFLFSAESRVNTAEYSRQRLVEEGIVPETVSFEAHVYSPETEAECSEALKEADVVIAVSTMFGKDELNPGTEAGARGAVLDRLIDEAHAQGKKVVFISAYIPYDASRYQTADAIMISFGSKPMNSLPLQGETCMPNLPCTICAAFGEFDPSGVLPIDIPALNEDYFYTNNILYEKGTSLREEI